jgi:glucose/arabinose dehydrogenase
MKSETRVPGAAAVAALSLLPWLACCGGGGGNLANGPPPPVVTLAVSRVFPALNFASPVGMLQAPGDANRWFVIEQTGRIKVFANQTGTSTATDFLDISGRISCCGEMGLLGVAFHPQFPSDPRVYVSYTAYQGAQLVSRLAEYQSRDGGATLDPASELILLHVNQPETNHNGGNILFGPDGFLYLGLGDGGGGGDMHGPIGNGQDLNTLLGKMLRIDVNAGVLPYGIPAGNPNAANALCGAGGTGLAPCAEIYAWGLRNPWRYSFDRNGALWIADVGQDSWEEIDRISAPANLGWRCREGAHPYNANCGAGTGLTDPVAEYAHNPDEAITGGFVYRGSKHPAIAGEYVFGDYVSGRLFHISGATSAGSTLEVTKGDASGISPSAFGEDLNGEIFVLDYAGGGLYELAVTP